jgi:ribosomal protein S6--L-glutamate ligase
MTHTLVMVNAEVYWADFFSEFDVHSVRLQTSKWLWHENTLWVFDSALGKRIKVDHVFWRIGAVRPQPNHRETLQLLRLSDVPCVNSARVMLRTFDRLSMLAELRQIGLPVVPFTAAVGAALMTQIPRRLPSVIKVGSYHAGYGKMRLTSAEQWQDMQDMVMATDDYFTLEPFIEYKKDIRVLGVGDQVWALVRDGSHWKVNVAYAETQIMPPPPLLFDYMRRTMQHFDADVLALDILETTAGEYVVLECNSVPGLEGFPESVTEAMVSQLKRRFSSIETDFFASLDTINADNVRERGEQPPLDMREDFD